MFRKSRFRHYFAALFCLILSIALLSTFNSYTPAQAGSGTWDLSAANRRVPIAGMPDWSKAGYLGFQGGMNIPPASSNIGNTINASSFGVKGDGVTDSSTALQTAIDSVQTRAGASYSNLTNLILPAGTIIITKQIYVDSSFLIITGAGNDPTSATYTKVVFRPDANTRYDQVIVDANNVPQQPDFANMTNGSAQAGWIWPGRAAFRVQTKLVAAKYASEYSTAPLNRKDLYEGTVNAHWIAGQKLAPKPGETVYSARTGDTVVYLASTSVMTGFTVGSYVTVMASNSANFYTMMGAVDQTQWQNVDMRQQMFRVAAVNATAHTVTLDKPLEWDLPLDNTSDGSAPILGTVYPSKIVPLTVIEGVGFQNFYLTEDLNNMPRWNGTGNYTTGVDANGYPTLNLPGQGVQPTANNYGNLAPDYAFNGILFKWAVNSWVDSIHTFMTGSHPIVTENAKNLQIQNNLLEGSWNKGKGGFGYFRGSRVWDSIYYNNTTHKLRHFTFQWDSSDNVALGNNVDNDFNIHGGWEHFNLIENNIQNVPWNHGSPNCTVACGNEGGGIDVSTWYPIYWCAGAKCAKWSGGSGPENVFFNNVMTKQLVQGGPFNDYAPYYKSDGSSKGIIFKFGWGRPDTVGATWEPLKINGTMITDWANNETVNYSVAPNAGVNALQTDSGTSLFLKSLGTGNPTPTNTPANTATSTSTATTVFTATPKPTSTSTAASSNTPTFVPATSTSTNTATTAPTTGSNDGAPYGGTPATIPGRVEVENYNTGGEGVAYHDLNVPAHNTTNPAFRTNEGVDLENCTDTGCGYNIGWVVAGEWTKYTVNVQSGGAYTIAFRVASTKTTGMFHLEVDGSNVTGSLAVPNTGGWQVWTNLVKSGVSLSAGQHVLRLVSDVAGENYNYIDFSLSGSSTNTPTTTPTRTTVPPTTTSVLTNTPTSIPTHTATSVPTNTTVPTLTPTSPTGNTNLAPSGIGYRWFGLTSSTTNTNKTAATGINDNNLTTDVPLTGNTNTDDPIGAFEAAGVIWGSPQTITSVKYLNGSFDANLNGVFTGSFGLQFTMDGTSWTNSGWSFTPSYAYDTAAAAKITYTFMGAATSVLGVRAVGQVHATANSTSWHANTYEVQAFGGAVSATNTPSNTPTTIAPTHTTVPATSTPISTSTAAPTSTSTPAWDCTKAYSIGALVSYNGHVYQALVTVPAGECGWIPGSAVTVWQDNGSSGPTAVPTIGATNPPPPPGSKVFAPYIDVSPGSSSAIMQLASNGSGNKHYTLAFILGFGCSASWFGAIQMNTAEADAIGTRINELRTAGGDVIVSFGGAAAPELANVCSDVASLQAQYQAVVSKYNLNTVDFDIEDFSPTAIDLRNKALKGLEAANPNLKVNYTLGVLQSGFTTSQNDVLNNAKSNGTRVDLVNIMTMDYGGSVSDMGAAAISGAQAARSQLNSMGFTNTQLGITPMIGVNDSAGETFTLANASSLVSWANSNGITLLAFWSVGRDNGGCPGNSSASDSCSGVSQSTWQFSSILQGFH